jgi:hypothetical protein
MRPLITGLIRLIVSALIASVFVSVIGLFTLALALCLGEI